MLNHLKDVDGVTQGLTCDAPAHGLLEIHRVYRDAMDTEARWEAAMLRTFGHSRYITARYTRLGEGAIGSGLRASFDAYVSARDTWFAFMKRCR